MPGASSSSSRHAVLVAAGIFLSRIAGLIRQRVFAHYFGSSDAADAFQAAFRIPNFLQNLFGEGVLSASFIPVYARLLAERDEEAAGRVAGACGALLALLTSVLVLLGVLTTPWLVDLVAPGFEGDKRELTIQLVRVLFPGAGLLVTSAWCLGILNSHRRFFLSYAAPVAWNATVIAALVAVGGRVGETDLAMVAAWGSVAGSALQFLVQLPVVLTVSRGLKPLPGAAGGHVRSVLVNFVPVVASRGVVQISAYVDEVLASLLPTGAVAGLVYAQTISMLPVSLFGMSVSAAELPKRRSVPRCASGSTADSVGSRCSWCPPQWRCSYWGTCWPRRFTSRAASRRWMRGMFGRFWPVRVSACSPPPWGGSTRRRSSRYVTRGRR
jgi:putative peptidoglycan lipid II flippase